MNFEKGTNSDRRAVMSSLSESGRDAAQSMEIVGVLKQLRGEIIIGLTALEKMELDWSTENEGLMKIKTEEIRADHHDC